MRIVESRAHATAVAFGPHGVLLRGVSGAGKSDLALRLIAPHGPVESQQKWMLVADDQVELSCEADGIVARAPEALRGKLEIRGLGIVDVPSIEQTTVALVVDLVAREAVERLPEPDLRVDLLGVKLPYLKLHAFDASAPAKIEFALGIALSPSFMGRGCPKGE